MPVLLARELRPPSRGSLIPMYGEGGGLKWASPSRTGKVNRPYLLRSRGPVVASAIEEVGYRGGLAGVGRRLEDSMRSEISWSRAICLIGITAAGFVGNNSEPFSQGLSEFICFSGHG